MRKLVLMMSLLSLAVGLAHSYATRAYPGQLTETACPDIDFSRCPDLCDSDERPCTFAVVVKGIKPGQKLTYSWEVSKGVIKTGQGTDTITVDLSGLGREERRGITALVEVGGMGEKCVNSAVCATAVANAD